LNDDGFAVWYEANYRRVAAAVSLFVGDLDVACDATDEAFARSLADWWRVREMPSPEAWTYRVAVNVARRRFRRATTERDLPFDGPRSTDDPADPLDPKLRDAVRALPDRQRAAIVLRYVMDLSQHEIAAAMGIADGTAAALLSQGRARLAAVLSGTSAMRARSIDHD